MSSIITKGFGVEKEAIITQGFGRKIEKIVIDAIETITKKRVGGSKLHKRSLEINKEKFEEYTILASLISNNDEDFSDQIYNEIKKVIYESGINLKIKDIKIETKNNNFEVKVSIKSNLSKNNKNSIKVRAKKD